MLYIITKPFRMLKRLVGTWIWCLPWISRRRCAHELFVKSVCFIWTLYEPLTHWRRVTHIGVNKLNHDWFRNRIPVIEAGDEELWCCLVDDVNLNKPFHKQWSWWCLEASWYSLWCNCDENCRVQKAAILSQPQYVALLQMPCVHWLPAGSLQRNALIFPHKID